MRSAVALPTVGEIARRLQVPIHRVVYILRTRQVAPLGRAGNARLFDESTVDFVAQELRKIGVDEG